MADKIRTRYHRLRHAAVFLTLGGISALSYWYFFMRPSIVCDDAYVSGNIIPIQALVPGIVVKVNVDNTMLVHSKQELLKQEQHLVEAQMEKAAASLAEAVRRTRSQFAEVDQLGGEVATLAAQRSKLGEDLSRYLQAAADGAVSSQKVSDTQADIRIMDQQMIAAGARLQKARALVSNTTIQSNPMVQKEKAEFISNYIQYRRSSVMAPVEGYVANRRVQAGQQVTAGQLLMNIVPLDDLWITANIKETDMKRVAPGQAVLVQAHVYGEELAYHGKVIGIEPAGGSTFSLFPPDNATGNYIHIVERVPVRISLAASELAKHPLRPGMSVTVDIDADNTQKPDSLASTVAVQAASYQTSIYERELAEAASAAQKIIQTN